MVAEQVGLPLVRFATLEAIEVLEAHPRRPLVEGAGRTVLKRRRVVVLAEPRCRIAVVLKNPPDGRVVGADDRVVAGETGGEFSDNAEAHRVVIATRDQRGPRWRAQRRGTELSIAQPCLGDPVHRRRGDDAAKSAADAVSLIVGQDQQHVGRAFGRHHARRPPRLRVLDVFLDHAAEFRLRRGELFPVNGRRALGEPGGLVGSFDFGWPCCAKRLKLPVTPILPSSTPVAVTIRNRKYAMRVMTWSLPVSCSPLDGFGRRVAAILLCG